MNVHISTPPPVFSPVFIQSLTQTSAPSVKVPQSASSLSLSQSFPLTRFLSCGSVWDSAVPYSTSITQTQPVSTDNSCLLFNTVQRAAWQAKSGNIFFFFIPWFFAFFFFFLHDSKFSNFKASSNWLEAANVRIFFYYSSSYAQSYHIWKITINREEMYFMLKKEKFWSAFLDIHQKRE